jgi:hypothetical protein
MALCFFVGKNMDAAKDIHKECFHIFFPQKTHNATLF